MTNNNDQCPNNSSTTQTDKCGECDWDNIKVLTPHNNSSLYYANVSHNTYTWSTYSNNVWVNMDVYKYPNTHNPKEISKTICGCTYKQQATIKWKVCSDGWNCSTADANNYPQFNLGVGDWYSDTWGNSGQIYYKEGNTFSITHGNLPIPVPANLNSFWEVEPQLQLQYPGWSTANLEDYQELQSHGFLYWAHWYIGYDNNWNIIRYNNGSLYSHTFSSYDQGYYVRLVKKNISPSFSYTYY